MATQVAVCSACGETKLIAARDLCRTCYSRWQRTGQVDRKNLVRGQCTVEGCEARAHGQGLCNKHLQRLRRTGTTTPGRTYPQRTGLITQHDLYTIWMEFKRVKNTRPVVKEWLDDFPLFVLGVGGGRPSRRHRLYHVDRDKPIGPGNYEWREALVQKLPGESVVDYTRRQKQAHKAMYPIQYKDAALKRAFGPNYGYAEFEKLFDEQKGLCKICGKPETATTKEGEPKDIATDHCHDTGQIRGLVCQGHNQALGLFEDDLVLMAKAMMHVARYKLDKDELQRAIDHLIEHAAESGTLAEGTAK